MIFDTKELSIATRGRVYYQQKAGSLLLPCNTNSNNFEPNVIINKKKTTCKLHSYKA